MGVDRDVGQKVVPADGTVEPLKQSVHLLVTKLLDTHVTLLLADARNVFALFKSRT